MSCAAGRPVCGLPGVGEAEHTAEVQGGQEVEQDQGLVGQRAMNFMLFQLWREGEGGG